MVLKVLWEGGGEGGLVEGLEGERGGSGGGGKVGKGEGGKKVLVLLLRNRKGKKGNAKLTLPQLSCPSSHPKLLPRSHCCRCPPNRTGNHRNPFRRIRGKRGGLRELVLGRRRRWRIQRRTLDCVGLETNVCWLVWLGH